MKTETIGAVIEIGSNSIKLLVATYRERVTALEEVVLESRISAGIGGAIPRLSEEGMRRGEASIMKLIERAQAFAPQDLIIAATSAVRDAENREVFVDRIHVQSSHRIRVLSGDEEADLIARGLAEDPEFLRVGSLLSHGPGRGQHGTTPIRPGRHPAESEPAAGRRATDGEIRF